MINFKAINGIPNIHFSKQTCSGCQLEKHTRTKMPKEATFHASKIMEIVYSDVCGPFSFKSTGGAKYFVTFVDDFFIKLWVYFISNKKQVLDKFQQFEHTMKNSIGHTIQTMVANSHPKFFIIFATQKASSESSLRHTHPNAMT